MVRTASRAGILALLLSGALSAQMPPQAPGPGGPGQSGPGGPGQPPANRGPAQDTSPMPEFATLKPVPHGEVRIVWYDSKVLGMQRRMHIWVPPGYDKSTATYPVLYLIHGGGQNDSAWTEANANAPYILDNLLAEGAIKPMIVVMPNGQLDGSTGGGGAVTPEQLAARAVASNGVRARVVDSLLTDTIPYVDAHYRTKTDRLSRAIAGFSFGGAESEWAAAGHPDKFAYVGVFSMGIQTGSTAQPGPIAGSGSAVTPEEFVAQNPAFFSDPARTNRDMRLVWIGVGTEDFTVGSGPKQLADTLTAHGIHNEYHLTPGGHNMANWRNYLRDFGAKLFR